MLDSTGNRLDLRCRILMVRWQLGLLMLFNLVLVIAGVSSVLSAIHGTISHNIGPLLVGIGGWIVLWGVILGAAEGARRRAEILYEWCARLSQGDSTAGTPSG
jgi:hypothetical protein